MQAEINSSGYKDLHMAPKGPESYFLPAKASYPLLSWSQIMFVPGHKCCCWICPEGASENRVCAGCAPGTCPCNYMRTHTVTLSLCRPPGPGGKRGLGWSALLSWKRPISSATVQPAGHARQCSRTRPSEGAAKHVLPPLCPLPTPGRGASNPKSQV